MSKKLIKFFLKSQKELFMNTPIPEIHPTKILEYKSNGYQLIDVRSEEEFNGELSHIPGAQLIPMGESLESWLEDTNPNEKVIFICRSGGRSSKATAQALKKGFKEVLNMSGGMLLWNALEK